MDFGALDRRTAASGCNLGLIWRPNTNNDCLAKLKLELIWCLFDLCVSEMCTDTMSEVRKQCLGCPYHAVHQR